MSSIPASRTSIALLPWSALGHLTGALTLATSVIAGCSGSDSSDAASTSSGGAGSQATADTGGAVGGAGGASTGKGGTSAGMAGTSAGKGGAGGSTAGTGGVGGSTAGTAGTGGSSAGAAGAGGAKAGAGGTSAGTGGATAGAAGTGGTAAGQGGQAGAAGSGGAAPVPVLSTWFNTDPTGPTVQMTTADDLADIVKNAASGSTIVVAPGDYIAGVVMTDKTLVFKAKDPANMPTFGLTSASGHVFQLQGAADLRLHQVKLKGGKSAVQGAAIGGSAPTIALDGVTQSGSLNGVGGTFARIAVVGSTLSGNKESGLIATGALADALDATVIDSQFDSNGGYGLALKWAHGNHLPSVSATGNGGVGIFLEAVSLVGIQKITSSNNGGGGVGVVASSLVFLGLAGDVGTVSGNTFYGIAIDKSAPVTIRQQVVAFTKAKSDMTFGDGIIVQASDTVVLDNVTSTSAARAAVSVFGGVIDDRGAHLCGLFSADEEQYGGLPGTINIDPPASVDCSQCDTSMAACPVGCTLCLASPGCTQPTQCKAVSSMLTPPGPLPALVPPM